MQKIRILLYTDHPDIVNSKSEPVGLTDLIRFILHKTKGLFEVEFTSINRHVSLITKSEVQGATKLSWGLLSQFDELWVFGERRINIPGPTVDEAQPYNELDDYEVAALEKWMNSGGGILFTGDHSEPNPITPHIDCDEPGHKSFLTLGRALGYRIPRAQQLRVWEGPPTSCVDQQQDNVNTQVKGKCILSIDALCHQSDDIPQTLLSLSPPHKLFSYVNSNGDKVPIEVLPDHAHEGKVLVPEMLDHTWPKDSPFPVVAARGFDKRAGLYREYDLVVAYDGHPVKVGRIVADSSFHHFINKNLIDLVGKECCGTPEPGTHLDQIAHYYMNLVLWLAPPTLRNKIKIELPFRLAKHSDVLEARGRGVRDLGLDAESVASFEWGNSNLYQLFGGSDLDTSSDRFDDPIAMAFCGERIPSGSKQVASEDVLGWLIYEYHEFFRSQKIHSPGFLEKDPASLDLIANGMARAFRDQPLVADKLLASLRDQS